MGKRRIRETEEEQARRELISEFLSAANIQSIAYHNGFQIQNIKNAMLCI